MRLFCFFIICFYLVSTSGFSQDKTTLNTQATADKYEYYKHKSSVQKTYGWVAVGSGVLLYGIGLSQPANNYYIDNDPSKGYPASKRTPFYIAGTLAELACIPFFINANNNKKKAIALKNESALIFRANNYISYPALALSLKL